MTKFKSYKIAIDNGHGIKTAGKRTPPFPANGKVIHEWEFNHPTAKELERVLRAQGHQVLMVSDTSVDTPLATRVKMANDWGADVFISIHYNAFKSLWGTHGGVETLHSTNSIGGKRLADLVQSELVQLTGLRNRGSKPRSDLYVLNNTRMVAILPECGFMDNLQEASLMLNETYQIKCATAIANGINKYLGAPISVPNVPSQPIPQVKPTPIPVVPPKVDLPSVWAKEAWDWGVSNKLVDGTKPQDPITREQMILVLNRFMGMIK